LFSFTAVQLNLCGHFLLQTLADTQVAQAVFPFGGEIDQAQLGKFCSLSANYDQVVLLAAVSCDMFQKIG
jgi:hypothetical protein